jgi:hypothetical protein
VATRCAESVILDERIESSVCGAPDRADSLDRSYRRSTQSRIRAIALLSLLVDTASARGLKRIGGDVLAINEAMKVFAKAHGFTLSRSHDGPTLVRVELRLNCERA